MALSEQMHRNRIGADQLGARHAALLYDRRSAELAEWQYLVACALALKSRTLPIGDELRSD